MGILIGVIILLVISCRTRSHGFEYYDYHQEEIPPQMVIVEGEIQGSDTIRSFCASKYEETNFQYRSYLEFLLKYKQKEKFLKALPDTNVWIKTDIPPYQKEYMVKNYFRNKKFDDYPVVGLSRDQIKK
jgi:hypothetical protein